MVLTSSPIQTESTTSTSPPTIMPTTTTKKKLKHRFDILKKLGQGTFGKVQLAIDRQSGQTVAIKTIRKSLLESDTDYFRIRREIQIMSSISHPHIIRIYEVLENRDKIVLVMEYASGGELYDYLANNKNLPEEEVRRIFRQIVMACYYCHKHRICHRDLKLENILLDGAKNAKLADFGLSNIFGHTHQPLKTFCGSPLYASPEIVRGIPYQGPEVDCWSLGVLLYTLIYGAMPFDGSNFKKLVRQISNGDYYEPSQPSPASALIRAMLTVDVEHRATVERICQNEWLNRDCEDNLLQMAEEFANRKPVRMDLLVLALAPTVATDDVKMNEEQQQQTGGVKRSQSLASLMELQKGEETKRKCEKPTPEKAPQLIKSTTETICTDLEGAACTELLKEQQKQMEQEGQKPSENDEELITTTDTKLSTKKIKDKQKENIKTDKSNKDAFRISSTARNDDKEMNEEKSKKKVLKDKNIIENDVNNENKLINSETATKIPTIPTPAEEVVEEEVPIVKNDEQQVKNAVNIISNALDGATGGTTRKSKSRPCCKIARKPPIAGRSSTSSFLGSIPATAKTEPVEDEEKNEVENKTSSAEITLKSATLPRRRKTSKAEIRLNYPTLAPSIGFRTEMSHPLPQPPPPDVESPPARRESTTIRPIHITRQESSDKEDSSKSSSRGGEPIRKSPREYIIPIAVEGGGYVTPRAGSLEPSERSTTTTTSSSGGTRSRPKFGLRMTDSDEDRQNFWSRDDDNSNSGSSLRMHRLRNTKRANLESVSSGDEEEEDEDDGFEILTAENLFSTLLSRVRDLTQRLNVDDGGGGGAGAKSPFPPTSRLLSRFDHGSNFWNFHRPFSRQSSLSRTFSRDRNSTPLIDDSMASPLWRRSTSMTRHLTDDLGSRLMSGQQRAPGGDETLNDGLTDEETLALSYLTPALSRRIHRQLMSRLAKDEWKNDDKMSNKPLLPIVVEKQRKERETQKVLREIRRKRATTPSIGASSTSIHHDTSSTSMHHDYVNMPGTKQSGDLNNTLLHDYVNVETMPNDENERKRMIRPKSFPYEENSYTNSLHSIPSNQFKYERYGRALSTDRTTARVNSKQTDDLDGVNMRMSVGDMRYKKFLPNENKTDTVGDYENLKSSNTNNLKRFESKLRRFSSWKSSGKDGKSPDKIVNDDKKTMLKEPQSNNTNDTSVSSSNDNSSTSSNSGCKILQSIEKRIGRLKSLSRDGSSSNTFSLTTDKKQATTEGMVKSKNLPINNNSTVALKSFRKLSDSNDNEIKSTKKSSKKDDNNKTNGVEKSKIPSKDDQLKKNEENKSKLTSKLDAKKNVDKEETKANSSLSTAKTIKKLIKRSTAEKKDDDSKTQPKKLSSPPTTKQSYIASTIQRLRSDKNTNPQLHLSSESGLLKRACSLDNCANWTNKNVVEKRKSLTKILDLFEKCEQQPPKNTDETDEKKKKKKSGLPTALHRRSLNEEGLSMNYGESVEKKSPDKTTVMPPEEKPQNKTTKLARPTTFLYSKRVLPKNEKEIDNLPSPPPTALLKKSVSPANDDDWPIKHTTSTPSTFLYGNDKYKKKSGLPTFNTSNRRSLNFDQSPTVLSPSSDSDWSITTPVAHGVATASNYGYKRASLSPTTPTNNFVGNPNNNVNDNEDADLSLATSVGGMGGTNDSVIDRIRRKSFYTRFNNEKSRPKRRQLSSTSAPSSERRLYQYRNGIGGDDSAPTRRSSSYLFGSNF